MRPLKLEEQSQKSIPLSIRRTSHSTRDRLRHSLRRLTPDFRANQRRHISQFSFSTGDQSKTLSTDFPLDSSESLARLRKRLEPSCLPMGPNFDEMLEKYMGEIEELLPRLPETELIELLYTLADRLDELLYPLNGDAGRIRKWGKRLEDLCQLLPSSPSKHSPKQALITRAQAMMGILLPSIAYVNGVKKKWDPHSVHAAGTVVLAAAFHQSLFRSLELILIGNPCLSIFISKSSHIDKILRILLLQTPDDLTVIIQRAITENWLVPLKEKLGYVLLSAYRRDPQRQMVIIRELQANNIPIKPLQILDFCFLSKDPTHTKTVQKLYNSIPLSDHYQHIHTGIYLAAKLGNSKQAQALFDKLKSRDDLETRDIKNLLLSYAKGGHVREILRVMDEFYPKNDEGQRPNVPYARIYSIAMLAHAEDQDFDGVITWLEEMQRSGFQPDHYAFTAVIRAYISKNNDLQGLSDVFCKMRNLGAKLEIDGYCIFLRDLADRKDAKSAEFLYKMACEDGLIPNVRMTNKLIEIFVASGSLAGATRFFDYLISQPRIREYLPLQTYNFLIEGHISMGAPFTLVSRLFLALKTMKLVPDRSSYYLLVSSACDAGELHKARDIYYEMVREEEANPSFSLIFAHVLQMIMIAFLRQGNRPQAKEMYDEMIERGIQPSRNAYTEIIRSYQKEGSPESLRIAHEFIKRLDSTSKEDRKSYKSYKDESDGKSDPVQLYGPLLHHYALQGNVDECERLYAKYLEDGGKPTIDTHGYLLEAYRRSKHV